MDTERHRVELSIPMVPEMELAAGRTAEAVAELMKLDADCVDETTNGLKGSNRSMSTRLSGLEDRVAVRALRRMRRPWKTLRKR